jgi:hypothetical protein
MTVVNDITLSFNDETSILTVTITKTDIFSGAGGFTAPAPPVETTVEIDLS